MDIGKDTWNAVAAVAAAVAAITTLVISIITYQALVVTKVTVSVSTRNDMVKSIDEAITKFKEDSSYAQYFFLVLRNVAENQHDHILTKRDADFINDYLKQQRYLCNNEALKREWNRLKIAVNQTAELVTLVGAILDTNRNCQAEVTP